MRNLPLLLALLLLAALGAAGPAQGSLLSLAGQAQPFVAFAEEEEEEEEAEEEETEGEEAEDAAEEAEIEREICAEDPELCEEEEPAPARTEPTGKAAEPCALRSARAALTANPGKRRLRLTVHYKSSKPATVSVEASLESSKGTVRLGTDHARFRRSGVYRDSYELAEKQMKKAAAARGFSVELNVVNAPASCRIELTGPSRRARR